MLNNAQKVELVLLTSKHDEQIRPMSSSGKINATLVDVAACLGRFPNESCGVLGRLTRSFAGCDCVMPAVYPARVMAGNST